MKEKMTTERAILWLKAAQKRQQDWQEDVKKRWAEKRQSSVTVCV